MHNPTYKLKKPSASKLRNMPLLMELRKTLGTDAKMRKNAYELVKVFVSEYEDAFQDIAILNRRYATAMMKRAYAWCGEDSEKLAGLIRFVVENWDDIRNEIGLEGRPSVGLFGSATLFHRICDLQAYGIKKKTDVKARFVEDTSPAVGWA